MVNIQQICSIIVKIKQYLDNILIIQNHIKKIYIRLPSLKFLFNLNFMPQKEYQTFLQQYSHFQQQHQLPVQTTVSQFKSNLLQQFIMQGYLKVWQGLFYRWRDSYFILHNGILTYCDKKGGHKQGQIYLKIASIIAVIDDPLIIRIHSGTNVLSLRANHPQQRIKWMKIMNLQKHKLQEEQKILQRHKQSKNKSMNNNLNKEKNSSDQMIIQNLEKLIYDIWIYQAQFEESISQIMIKIYSSKQLLKAFQSSVKLSKQIKKKLTYAIDMIKKIIIQNVKVVKPNIDELNKSQQQSILEKSWTSKASSRPRQKIISMSRVENFNIATNNNSIRKVLKKNLQQQYLQNDINPILQLSGQTEFKSFLQQQDDQQLNKFISPDISNLRNEPKQLNERNVNNFLKMITQKDPIKKKLFQQNNIFLQTIKFFTFDTQRTKLPSPNDNKQINLIGIIKGCIGSDIFSLNLPIITHQPLSYLQRLAEQMLYQNLLVKANQQQQTSKRILYVAAFASSIYSTTLGRTKLPFKPVLGQTFEIKKQKYKYISEQVQSNISAFHCQSDSYILYGSIQNQTKFTGKSIQLEPKGYNYVYLKKPKQIIYFTRCKTQYRNLIFGETTIHNIGNIQLIDQNDVALLTFKDRGFWFDDSTINYIEGWVKHSGVHIYNIYGTWNKQLQAYKSPHKHNKFNLWKNVAKQQQQYYGFTHFAMNLNHLNLELLETLPSTDSRLRPDLRALEFGMHELAQQQKERLYKKQKRREQYHQPMWFSEQIHKLTKTQYYAFNNRYWNDKQQYNWDKEIF